MNKIAKKILAFTSLLTLLPSAACGLGGIGGTSGESATELEKGFWAETKMVNFVET